MELWEEEITKDININGYKLVEYRKGYIFENTPLENISQDSQNFEKEILKGKEIELKDYILYYTKFEDPKVIVLFMLDKDDNNKYNTDEVWTEEVIEAIKKDIEN